MPSFLEVLGSLGGGAADGIDDRKRLQEERRRKELQEQRARREEARFKMSEQLFKQGQAEKMKQLELNRVKGDVGSESDIVKRFDKLEGMKDSISPETYVAIRDELNNAALQEQQRSGTLSRKPIRDIVDPAMQSPPQTPETREATTAPRSGEEIKKSAEEAVKNPNATDEELEQARETLIRMSAGNVNAKGVTEIDKELKRRSDKEGNDLIRAAKAKISLEKSANDLIEQNREMGKTTSPDVLTALGTVAGGNAPPPLEDEAEKEVLRAFQSTNSNDSLREYLEDVRSADPDKYALMVKIIKERFGDSLDEVLE